MYGTPKTTIKNKFKPIILFCFSSIFFLIIKTKFDSFEILEVFLKVLKKEPKQLTT